MPIKYLVYGWWPNYQLNAIMLKTHTVLRCCAFHQFSICPCQSYSSYFKWHLSEWMNTTLPWKHYVCLLCQRETLRTFSLVSHSPPPRCLPVWEKLHEKELPYVLRLSSLCVLYEDTKAVKVHFTLYKMVSVALVFELPWKQRPRSEIQRHTTLTISLNLIIMCQKVIWIKS